MRGKQYKGRVYVRRPIAERLMEKIHVGTLDECWEWTAYRNPSGYGEIAIEGGSTSGSSILAHRATFEIHIGPVPDGLFVLHKCDNPPCCNPAHLFLGTHEDNMADMRRKARSGRIRLSEDEIKAIREAHGHQRAVASRFGVSQSTVWRIRHRLQRQDVA